MTLAEFLLARVAQDEEVARMVGGTWPYRWEVSTSNTRHAHGQDLGPRGSVEMPPARMLAECEAKRRVVEACARTAGLTQPDRTGYLSDFVLAQLALAYADHPDYRQEWAP